MFSGSLEKNVPPDFGDISKPGGKYNMRNDSQIRQAILVFYVAGCSQHHL